MSVPGLARIAGASLIVSGVARFVGETVQIWAGGPTPISGLTAAIALFAFAFGLTGIWDEASRTLLGRIAIFATVLGALGFVVVTLYSVFVGTPPAQEVARTLPFIGSALFTLVGVGALAIWLIRAPRYPDWVGIVMIASVAGSVTTSVLPVHPVVQPLIDIAMAACFVQFGLTMTTAAAPPVRSRPHALDTDLSSDPIRTDHQ